MKRDLRGYKINGGNYMFAGFELTFNDDLLGYKELGKQLYNNNKKIIKRDLEFFLNSEGTIDGTKLQNEWFPQIQSDIFISHSHLDHEKAMELSGWLSTTFNLNVFIDSCVWGAADDLLRMIDDIYCLNESVGSYSYEKRNYSTSHVHMMLSVALSSIIDKTECLIFLNTPSSISTKSVIQQQTNSPWIYMEVALSQMIRKNPPSRKEIFKESRFEASEKQLDIQYRLDTEHLQKIDSNDLENWKVMYNQMKSRAHALDVLYSQNNLIRNPNNILR